MSMGDGERIENLARALEREMILMNLEECTTLEDFQKYRETLQTQLESVEI